MSDSATMVVLAQAPLEAAHRPTFTKPELQEYMRRINIPVDRRKSPIWDDGSLARTKEHGLPLLHLLTRYHTCAVPFENLELHYSAHRQITLEPRDLYRKIVSKRRGGRCMEHNTFFGTVLRSVGFEVRNCAGRVARAVSPWTEVRRDQGKTYDGWNHMLNLVRLDKQWYVVDVGMGAMGPNLPYPLEDGFETTSIAPRKIRLQLRAIPETYADSTLSHTGPPKLWCYDVCYKPSEKPSEDSWVPFYCFTETEFLPQDYEMMSWYTSTHERSFFTKMMMCTRMVMDESGEKLVGDVTLVEGIIRKTIGGERETIRECGSEKERIEALEEVFDVVLTEEERAAVRSDVAL